MSYSITITNTNGKKFRFYSAEVQTLSYRLQTKLFKVEIPGAKAEDNIIINLGRARTLSFPFKFLKNVTNDASVGTHTTVDTIQKKFDYFDGTMITDDVEDLYTIDVTSTNLNISNVKAIIEDFNIDLNSQNPESISGTMTFTVGGGNQ